MRRAGRADLPGIWTRGRTAEFAAMLALTGAEISGLVLLSLTRDADSWGATGRELLAIACLLSLQMAWEIWFVIRAGVAIKHDRP